ncbi:MAG TPA: PhzF family phenazine biosynthesis protein [Gemmatimonadales bacterium]|nr:PhzF family phenazine biosynthesis protein [Gemmatimonadales bacterium]
MRFFLADVFTDKVFGGNQLAVFPSASGLSTSLMQAIARELNLSETVFVFPPDDPAHTRRIRIFTPGAELPFAGHPTIGAAFVLAWSGEVPLGNPATRIVLEERVGPVPVSIRGEEGRVSYCELTTAQLPERGPAPPPLDDLAATLSIRPEDIETGDLAPGAASCGVPYCFVPLRDEAALRRARIDLSAWERSLSGSWAPALYPFVRTDGRNGVDFRARMFAPGIGIPEDPATGSAAAALPGYLGPGNAESGTLSWVVEQGVEMGRPSRIQVACDLAGGRIRAVRVGGTAVLVAEARLAVPTG